MTQAAQQYDPAELAARFGGNLEAAIAAAKRSLRAIEARDDLITFQKFRMPDPNNPDDVDCSRYDARPHHILLANELMAVERGETMRLAISIPPQTGKSELTTRGFPAWFEGRHPYSNLMFGMYNQTFAEEFGEDVRHILQSEEYGMVFPHVELRKGSKAKDHLVTTHGGKLAFLGRGGSGTGRPADGFLIDDPIKDAKEAQSLTTRNDIWEWFTRVANTRIHVLSWIIIIATRWSEDDLIGRLTDPSNPCYDEHVANQWKVINIPAIMDNAEMAAKLGKKLGEPLWPERFPMHLLETARRMDPIGFSALQMGKPTPPEGSYFKANMLNGYEQKDYPNLVRNYQTCDLAVSTARSADKTCDGIWSLDENDELWLHWDLFWGKHPSDESVNRIIANNKSYRVFEMFFERGQMDKAIGPFLEKRQQEEKDHTPITRMTIAGNKGMRAQSFRARCAQGKVHFPVFAPWWPAAKEQLLKFTGSGNDTEDDFVDMCSLIGQALGEQIVATGEPKSSVTYPKVGSFAWTKWAHNEQQRHMKAQRAMRGM